MDSEIIVGHLAKPMGRNKGAEVKNYQLDYTFEKVRGSERRQQQLKSLSELYGLSPGEYELMLP